MINKILIWMINKIGGTRTYNAIGMGSHFQVKSLS
jgi:hypothetical protein